MIAKSRAREALHRQRGRGRASGAPWCGLACGWLLATSGHADPGAGKLLRDVRFARYTNESSYAELARRLLSRADAERFDRKLAAARGTPDSQPLDLAGEKFLVYVPARKPETGYALLVFVPPWQDARLPAGWAPVLDERGLIFVTAARSGNEESALGRREPLALLAARNIMHDYPVDARRVLVGGFSGGSRVALRLALGYPDLFQGALLNAGSDALADASRPPPVPLPPRELLYRFQESTRLAYVTGARDGENRDDDLASIKSMQQSCVFNLLQFSISGMDHEVADARSLARALDFLLATPPADPDRLERCRKAELPAPATGLYSHPQ